MSFLKNIRTYKVCQKIDNPDESGINPDQKPHWYWRFMPFTGLAALIWFLIRVIPKPSRATYPCQRVAFPIASGFIIWLLGLAGSAVAYRKAKAALAKARYAVAAIAIIASVAFMWGALSNTDIRSVFAADDPNTPNAPIGTAKGIHPGRVAWIHDPNATSWNGSDGNNNPPYWWQDTSTNQQVVNQMLSKALRALTEKGDDASAWDAIFRNYNQQHGRGDVGYTAGEKIAIKINWVLSNSPDTMEKKTQYNSGIDDSPQLAIALLKQLTDIVGVDPCDICIGDPNRVMPNYWYNKVEANCPNVVYLTCAGYAGSGRTITTYDLNAPFYWSDPITSRTEGKTPDYIPLQTTQATYFINFPILKSHNDAGITLCGKNHFGSLRTPSQPGYYNMHDTRATETPGMGHYRAIVDLLGHPKLGGKTLLCLVDGLYSGRSWDSHPIKWQMAPFNNDWPSSIFLSQDPIAVDSVCYDFMFTEWDESPTTINGYPHKSGAHDYLHEAALIPNSPSGVSYHPNDINGIDVLTQSIGVHEHWNNAADKQYSRNLDPVDGNGIELETEPSRIGDIDGNGRVDFRDFAIIAAAWGSQKGDAIWDANCDISEPSNGVINYSDLAIFCSNWLNVYFTDLIQPGATLQEAYSVTNIGFEGPVWNPNSHKLFFTRRTSPFQILRLDGPNTVTVWMNPSLETNGMIIANDGNLLCCDENPRQITSRHIGLGGPGSTKILADSSDGISRKPNDLCQLSNGNIYFTCPDWSAGPNDTGQGVFLLRPNGSVSMVKNGIYQPNGIITSLDETKLYVAESRTNADTSRQRWWIFDINNSDGSLGNGAIFFKPSSPPDTSNVPDGMTIDEFGNLYFTGLGGVWIVSPAGVQLGFISVYAPANICFGGPNGRTLYITAKGKAYSLAMCVRGGESISW